MGFRTVIRFLMMRRHRSKVPTGIVPLSFIRSAVIYRDPKEPSCIREIKRYFEPKGIIVREISEFDSDIRTDEDLFIAISTFPSLSERYAATSSTAKFKVGRRQLKGNVYDLVVSDNSEMPKSQSTAFAAITEFIDKIQ